VALHFQRGVAVERVHECLTCVLLIVITRLCEFKFSPLPLPLDAMQETEAIRNLKSILRGTLRVIINDGRAFVGTFVGTDKSLNILLLNTEEFHLDAGENTAGRYVGQVMIPWRIIQSIGLQIGETNAHAQAYPDQVRVPAKFCPP
jgi:small nuclear ribonucleoprotein (snRNP)-like protein